MQVLGVHHVAMAVEDLDEAIETWSRLYGAQVELRGRMEEQGVDAAYLRLGSGRIELVSPLGGENPVARFLGSRGQAMHHVALEVDDIGVAIDELARGGANVLDRTPRRGLGGHTVSFVHPDSQYGVLTEVVEHDG